MTHKCLDEEPIFNEFTFLHFWVKRAMELLWPTTFQPHVKLPLQIWGILRLIKTRDYLFRFRHLSKSVCRNPVLVAPFTHCQLFQTTLRDLFLPFYHRHETSTLKPIFHFSRFVKSLFHSISYSGSDILYGNKNNDGQNLWIIGEPLVNCRYCLPMRVTSLFLSLGQ